MINLWHEAEAAAASERRLSSESHVFGSRHAVERSRLVLD